MTNTFTVEGREGGNRNRGREEVLVMQMKPPRCLMSESCAVGGRGTHLLEPLGTWGSQQAASVRAGRKIQDKHISFW